MFPLKSRIKTSVFTKIILTGVFLLFFSVVQSQSYYFDSLALNSCRELFLFRFDEAATMIDEELALHPDNLIPIMLSNYIDFFILFIGENQLEFEMRKGNRSNRITMLERGDKESPFYRYCLSQIYLQWAFVRLKFGEYATAGIEIRRAYSLLRENEEKFS